MKRLVLFFSLVLILLATACSSRATQSAPTSAPSVPQVIINSPASGMQFTVGADVSIQSTASDAQGILRTELLVDGQSVRSDAIPTGKSQPQFQVAQTWKATTPGTHIVIVRATNENSATGEASLTLTVIDAPKPTTAPASASSSAASTASATAKPATAPTTAPTPVPPTAKPPAPTTAPSSTSYTVTFTEAQVNTWVNNALAATQENYVSAASVSLQNGQVSTNVTYKGLAGATVTGHVAMTVTASNCHTQVTITQATIGQANMTDARKAALSQSFNQAIENQLAQKSDYRCVDSVTIANGAMTFKYH